MKIGNLHGLQDLIKFLNYLADNRVFIDYLTIDMIVLW